MASVYEINQPAQSDIENEYEIINIDGSIDILAGPGTGTDSGKQEDTDGSDVRKDAKKSERTDAATGEGSLNVETHQEDEGRDENLQKHRGTPKPTGAHKQIMFEMYDNIVLPILSITSKIEALKIDPQLESVLSKGTFAQTQDKEKYKLEPENIRYAHYGGKGQNLHEDTAKSPPKPADDCSGPTKLDPQLETAQIIDNGVLLKCPDEITISRQYIKQKATISKQIDQLGISARLTFCNLDIKLYNEGCLMALDYNLLAKVRILDTQLVFEANDFATAKKVLLEQLRIVNVLQDDLMSEKMDKEKSVFQAIQTALNVYLENGKLTVDCIQLTYMINTHDGLDFVKLCEEIKNNRLVSQELRQTARLFLLAEARYFTRGNTLARFDYRQPETNSPDLIGRLSTMLKEYLTAYKEQLLKKAPTCLYETLSNISNDRIMFVQSSDVQLFSDLIGVLDEKIFQKPLADLAGRWIDHVAKTSIKKLLSIKPQISPIFYFLVKSLEDLIVEISSRTNHTVQDLLTSDHSGWYPIKKIIWKSENVLTQCIEREYFFIFKLLKHFDLDLCNEKKPFVYDVKLFEASEQRSIWRQPVKNTKRLFGCEEVNENSLKTPDEKYIWCCLLDDVLYNILPAEYRLDSFEQIIQSYIDFLNKAGSDQLETLRVITHNTVRFVVQTVYVVQEDSSSIDKQILQKQLDLMNAKAIEHSLTLDDFRNLVEVFNLYWEHRDCITSIPFKIPLPEMTSLKTALLEIVSVALDKNVSPEAMVSFFRKYCDLLADLNDVQFDWYIKSFPGVRMGLLVEQKLIKLIDNKWANTDNRTYSVEAVEKFAKTVPSYLRPKHYVLEILLTLISYIKKLLQKTSWTCGDQLSEIVQISTTTELIFAIRNSFLYLKEQPEYVSFETFYDERVKPFASALDNSSCHSDFINRIHLIKESFWYIRKQNEMDIDKGLELFADLNGGFETEALRSAYQKYSDAFQQFMEMSCDVSEYIAKATHIANKVKTITFVKPHHTWNSNDKSEKMPGILAGLAVVWSILVSKDVSSTGQYLTPHRIQILCILRMLGVDRAADGVVSHLSQVLTGQGKSLVLGLTAALLALTGHKPRIVCYNEYLVQRDRQDFEDFISIFNLSDSIIYGTFENMADSLIAPVINGERMGLRSLIEQMLLGNEQLDRNELVAGDMQKSVLLIDEVDVFFTSQFYGKQCRSVTRLMLPGLDLIQQEIWKIVSQRKCRNVDEIIKDMYSYIESEEMTKEEEFHKLIADEKVYKILRRRDGKVDSHNSSFKQLFDGHLKKMIKCALEVFILPAEKWNDYKLSSQGIIVYKRSGKFVNNYRKDYYPVFNYFRLRGTNFSTKVGNGTNYGYLILNCGAISYALLPKSYPLILGVSSTLVDLNQNEKQSIKTLYDINEMSLMPTYFGGSNFSFDQSQDFRVLDSLSEWKTEIFARVNALLGAHRSVLVFFESDLLLNSFHAEYCSQFDRLNVLTENTESALMNQYIEEAGVPKTTTLATSSMGRGVDYKSSVAIEKHGGLHVIQTFFSLDVKEETHIKGRTARKDNHGSYELLICKVHLSGAGFCGDNLTYRSLHETRLARALEDNERVLKTISDCQHDHDTTMTYLESFFKR